MKILVAGSGTGKGVAVDTKTKKETFMKMFEVQAGLGFGVKKFRLVWVFETPDALKSFIDSGWELGGQGVRPSRAVRRAPLSKTRWPSRPARGFTS
jgi:lipid-binding SYLF domain-containing protein